MPERARPDSPYPTPASAPISSNFAVPSVHKEGVRCRVVGDEEIHLAVVIDVGRDNAQGFTEILSNADDLLTSVNVPSPLLWKSQLGIGW